MRLFCAALLFWLVASPALAEWDDETRLVLAQALAAEVGWDAELEWASVSHILLRRAERAGMPLERMVRRYCSVFKVRAPSRRQRWVRRLPWGELDENPGFSARVDWRRYIVKWRAVRAFVWRLELGMVSDPTPRAEFFASRHDLALLPHEAQLRVNILPSTIVHPETGERVTFRNRIYRMRRQRGPETGSGTAPRGAVLDANDAV